jgi:hypothetical protein
MSAQQGGNERGAWVSVMGGHAACRLLSG